MPTWAAATQGPGCSSSLLCRWAGLGARGAHEHRLWGSQPSLSLTQGPCDCRSSHPQQIWEQSAIQTHPREGEIHSWRAGSAPNTLLLIFCQVLAMRVAQRARELCMETAKIWDEFSIGKSSTKPLASCGLLPLKWAGSLLEMGREKRHICSFYPLP